MVIAKVFETLLAVRYRTSLGRIHCSSRVSPRILSLHYPILDHNRQDTYGIQSNQSAVALEKARWVTVYLCGDNTPTLAKNLRYHPRSCFLGVPGLIKE